LACKIVRWAKVIKDAGIRGVYAHGIPGDNSWWAYSDRGHPDDIRRIREQYFSSDDQLLTLAMAARAVGNVTPETAQHDWALAREMVSAKTATETERVRNTLLASISHDFRTPLSSILGSATSLIDYGDKLDAASKADLLKQIKQETESLDEMVRNLLAITRIESGALELRRDWIDLREIVDRIANASRRRGARHHIEVRLPADLPLVRADATLAEQAIGNVIGNAAMHTPSSTHVVVDALVMPSAAASAKHSVP
jgi:K+-sensing histidine kinase KdpD